jgi:hypothetical protein
MQVYRYLIQTFSRTDNKATEDKLRELGLEAWELIGVLPGSRSDPSDAKSMTLFFRRDATTDINL